MYARCNPNKMKIWTEYIEQVSREIFLQLNYDPPYRHEAFLSHIQFFIPQKERLVILTESIWLKIS